MSVPPLLAVGLLMNFVAFLFVLVAVVLILVILIQKGRGGGLSGAFGGGMAGGLLGSKTGDFLTWVTIVLVAIFLLLAVLLAKFYKPRIGEDFEGQGPVGTQQSTVDEETTLPETPGMAPPDVPADESPAPPVEAVPDANAGAG
jgi:preprotein translocase subunit SecG